MYAVLHRSESLFSSISMKFFIFCCILSLSGGLFQSCRFSGMSEEQARQVVRSSSETIHDDGSLRASANLLPPWERQCNRESSALSRTKLQAMLQLIGSGEPATLRDFYGETVLHKAAACGDVASMERFVKQGLDVNDRSTKDGATPLHQACRLGQDEAVDFLLSHGADPNIGDSFGETPLFSHYCASRALMERLLQAGANPNLPDHKGFYPVVLSGDPDLLVRYGADPNLLVTSTNNTVFMQRMLNFGDEPDPGVQAMLKHGADIHLTTDDGYTPLMMAAECGLVELVRELVAKGANVHARDRYGKTAADYTRRHSKHYRVLSDGGDSLAGTAQADTAVLRQIRRILQGRRDA